MQTKQLYRKAIGHWEEGLQVGMLGEEMAELTIAVNKFRRKRGVKELKKVIGEIADVKVMLEQIQVLFNIDDKEIKSEYLSKIEKLKRRLGVSSDTPKS